MRSTLNLFFTLGFLVSIPLLLSTVIANGQSFSCATAQKSAEFAICNSENLQSLDESLAAIYYHRKSNMPTTPQRQKISRDHNQWIEQRNSCDLDWGCLESRYKERINQLKL